MSLGTRRTASTVGHAGRLLLGHAYACRAVSGLRCRHASVWCHVGGPVVDVGSSRPPGLQHHRRSRRVGVAIGDGRDQHLRCLDLRYGLRARATRRPGSRSACPSGSRTQYLVRLKISAALWAFRCHGHLESALAELAADHFGRYRSNSIESTVSSVIGRPSMKTCRTSVVTSRISPSATTRFARLPRSIVP